MELLRGSGGERESRGEVQTGVTEGLSGFFPPSRLSSGHLQIRPLVGPRTIGGSDDHPIGGSEDAGRLIDRGARRGASSEEERASPTIP